MHSSPNETIPEYLLTFTWKQNENTIQEINDKKRSERVWNFWDYFRCREKVETKVSKIKVHISCRIKTNKYFSQKVDTFRDKTDFLALHPYSWTDVLQLQTFSVSSCMWKRLHRSFGSFRFHRLNRFYRLQCFYRAFSFYRSFHFDCEYRLELSLLYLTFTHEVWPHNFHTFLTVWHSLGTTLAHWFSDWLYVQRMHIFTYFKKDKLLKFLPTHGWSF